jgi:hypothetical protein
MQKSHGIKRRRPSILRPAGRSVIGRAIAANFAQWAKWSVKIPNNQKDASVIFKIFCARAFTVLGGPGHEWSKPALRHCSAIRQKKAFPQRFSRAEALRALRNTKKKKAFWQRNGEKSFRFLFPCLCLSFASLLALIAATALRSPRLRARCFVMMVLVATRRAASSRLCVEIFAP